MFMILLGVSDSICMFIRVLIYTVLSGSVNLLLTIRLRASHSQIDPVLLREPLEHRVIIEIAQKK